MVEVYINIRGERHYLWRAVDQEGGYGKQTGRLTSIRNFIEKQPVELESTTKIANEYKVSKSLRVVCKQIAE
ncbi:hypothetical protein [Vibrio sp. MA40-2]|uniref:hypothetical protein n=1 Tax=Vibrio sp. MA40-2 TaxID=3391828 RepID=UPI0039A5A941